MKIFRLLLTIMAFSSFLTLISCADAYDEIKKSQKNSSTETVGENGEDIRGGS
ncbi:hypothetical protein [Fulvivirga sediminis]|uniref:Lipoprotein n=1 Tax=Fulvivirga sediminis TaxID=2803949 RepID=A0A937FBP7_9BACT|nr:hypothetical protein [Fulvivirga sediminis]MBL3657528.1 hypothetical protein [Fulvivirga sediminis]